MHRGAGALTVLAALGVAAFASAQPAASKTAPKPPASAASASAPVPPPPVHASAIVRLATELAQGLGAVPAGALVAVSPLTTDLPAPKGDELAIRAATQLAGRLGLSQVHPQAATLAVARGVSGRAASLVYVQVELAKGELRATADLYPVVSNGWERLRNPAPGPRAHAFASAPLDAEIRTFLQPIVLEQSTTHKAKHDELDVVAVGCGDVDSDGGLELVIVSRARVVVGKLRAGKLAVVRSTPWTQLAARTPVPFREATGSIVLPRRGELLLGITDRGGVAVDPSLVTRRQLTGVPIPGSDGDACAIASPEYGAFEGGGFACVPPAKGEPASVLASPATRFDAIAALDLVGKDGATSQIVAVHEPAGKVRIRRSDASGKVLEASLDQAGAQLALADLDLDGVPELATSADLEGADAIVVWSWRANGLVQRLRLPTKEPVRALAACPPEEKGVPSLVAIVGSEVWLVR